MFDFLVKVRVAITLIGINMLNINTVKRSNVSHAE